MFPCKQFVRESSGLQLQKEKTNYISGGVFKGEEARDFYEKIIQIPSEKNLACPPKPTTRNKTISGCSGEASCNTIKNPQILPHVPSKISDAKISSDAGNSGTSANVKANNIWKAAETNATPALRSLLANNDINITDKFGWTSLMCAACSGAEECVMLLLNNGACVNITDKAGYNALHLARKNNHRGVIKLLTQDLSVSSEKQPRAQKSNCFYCELCKMHFKTSQKKHEASTSHLLTVGAKNSKTFYSIPDSNKGFQLLMRNGWNRERGLGPDGLGRKYPVKAHQKIDRSGVGAAKLKNVESTRSQNSTRLHTARSTDQDRIFERNYRREFL